MTTIKGFDIERITTTFYYRPKKQGQCL